MLLPVPELQYMHEFIPAIFKHCATADEYVVRNCQVRRGELSNFTQLALIFFFTKIFLRTVFHFT